MHVRMRARLEMEMEMEMEIFRAHEFLIGCLINNFQSLEIEINCLSDVE